MRTAIVLTVLVLATAACGDDADPAIVDLSGTWTGTYTHPTLPGSLELDLSSTDEALDGTFVLRYANTSGFVQTLTGTVTGTRPSATSLSFDIEHTSFTWSFVGQLTTDDLMQGTWTSLTADNLDGLFEVRRR